MKPITLSTLLKGAAWSGGLALCLMASPAQAQVELRIFPPPGFISTSRPVYHDGRATYRYRDNWYYRDGRSWRQYRQEPERLREWRNRNQPERRHYEREGYRNR
jgi:hypothetical protein